MFLVFCRMGALPVEKDDHDIETPTEPLAVVPEASNTVSTLETRVEALERQMSETLSAMQNELSRIASTVQPSVTDASEDLENAKETSIGSGDDNGRSDSTGIGAETTDKTRPAERHPYFRKIRIF